MTRSPRCQTASPAEQFTFMLRAPKDWGDGRAHDDECLCCTMHLERTRDGKVQFYELDNDMASDLTFEEVMRNRSANERKWHMSWGGFGPGWFEFEVSLQPGDRQVKVRILRAGLAYWPGDDDDDDRWEDGWDEDEDFGEEDWEGFEEDEEASQEGD